MEDTLIKTLAIKNPFTQEQVYEGIAKWPKTLQTCLKRSQTFNSLQLTLNSSSQAVKENSALTLETISEAAATLEPLLRTSTDVEKEGYDQVCFQGSPWSAINSIPFALVILSIFKSYIVPAFSILLPLLSWILPYILLKVIYNIPITFTEYMKILWRMWNGQAMPANPADLLNPPPAAPVDAVTRLKQLAQNGWTIFTLGQALWQPIQQARHYMRLEKDCLALGAAIITVKESASFLINKWGMWMPTWFPSWISNCPDDKRQAFAFVLDTPFWLRHTFRALGRFEVLYMLAGRTDVVPVQFVNSATPALMLKDFGDPSIPVERRVTSSLRLGCGKESHSILTGPNRGGKSSFMRGVLLNTLIGHSFGAAFAAKAQMSYISWIANGLSLNDTPGTVSMFEREVSFAASLLNKGSGSGLVLYDELFHSTNPPDAIRTSELFCDSFWKKTNCVSVVSTHVYALARSAPPNVKKLCVAAWVYDNNVKFSYAVQKGVCEVSSVDLLLKQHGIL